MSASHRGRAENAREECARKRPSNPGRWRFGGTIPAPFPSFGTTLRPVCYTGSHTPQQHPARAAPGVTGWITHSLLTSLPSLSHFSTPHQQPKLWPPLPPPRPGQTQREPRHEAAYPGMSPIRELVALSPLCLVCQQAQAQTFPPSHIHSCEITFLPNSCYCFNKI